MKLHIAAITAALTVITTNASAQPQARAQAGQPIVHSGLFMMSPDGTTSGSAVQTGDTSATIWRAR